MKLNNIKASFIFESNVVNNSKKHTIWKNGKFTFLLLPPKPGGSFNHDKNACLHTIKDHY